MNNRLEEGCLKTANRLIKVCKLQFPNVRVIKDINSSLIVSLFESITGHNLPDLLCPVNNVDEAHNVQAVIDTLSLDVLSISLSHITGEAVVAGDAVAISDLLEILDGILRYILTEKQETHISKSLESSITKSKNQDREHRYSSKSKPTDNKSVVAKIKMSNNAEILKVPEKAQSKKSKQKFRDKQREYWTYRKGEFSHMLKPTVISKLKHTSPKSATHRTSMKKAAVTVALNGQHNGNYVQRLAKSMRNQESSDLSVAAKSNQTDDKFSFGVEHLRHADKSTAESIEFVRSSKFPTNVSRNKTNKHLKSEEVEELYEKNFENKLRAVLNNNLHSFSPRNKASQIKKMHLQYLRKPLKKPRFSPCRKSYLLPHYLRRRSISQPSPKRLRFYDSSPKRKVETGFKASDAGLLQELKEKFPGVELPSNVLNHVREKYENHLMTMHHQLQSCLMKKPKSQIQAEEIAKKQRALSNLFKKELIERCCLKEVNDRKLYQNKLKYHVRDARLQSAKMKRYCEEFKDEMQKKIQKRNFSEELIIENTFKEVLNLQKEQVQILCEQVKETGERDAKHHLEYLDALENLYHNQFSMLAESLATEKKEAQEKIKAKKKVANEMRKEIQTTLQKEVREMQSNILEIMHDPHFRQLDADQYKSRIQKRFTVQLK